MITIECPKCGRCVLRHRESTDPDPAAKIVLQCPECNPGDFASPIYFDASGQELDWNTEMQARRKRLAPHPSAHGGPSQ